jgi:hypothetical protein
MPHIRWQCLDFSGTGHQVISSIRMSVISDSYVSRCLVRFKVMAASPLAGASPSGVGRPDRRTSNLKWRIPCDRAPLASRAALASSGSARWSCRRELISSLVKTLLDARIEQASAAARHQAATTEWLPVLAHVSWLNMSLPLTVVSGTS